MFTAGNPAVEGVLDKVIRPDNRATEYLAECHLGDYYLGSLSLVVVAR